LLPFESLIPFLLISSASSKAMQAGFFFEDELIKDFFNRLRTIVRQERGYGRRGFSVKRTITHVGHWHVFSPESTRQARPGALR